MCQHCSKKVLCCHLSANLLTLCKVMEHSIDSNLVKHLDTNGLVYMYDLQHGFRERRSCETQLASLVEDLVRKSSQGKKKNDLILPDFSKAFGKVNHSKLILKLHSYGIRGSSFHWIQAFLSNRQQRVVVEGEESDSVPVTSWVPQGSDFVPGVQKRPPSGHRLEGASLR